MAVSRAMLRLLRIRHLQEEQSHAELESAQGELRVLEQALRASLVRERRGRLLESLSAHTGEPADRAAAIEEMRAATAHSAYLQPRIADAQEDVNDHRGQFLARRVERLQAETLIDEAAARDAIEFGRRTQQAHDDWFLSRRSRRSEASAQPRIRRPNRKTLEVRSETSFDIGPGSGIGFHS